ncbi:hypothetical protein JCM8547_004554 [Rhodosporidiobolus lusitaniae]
MEKARRPVPSLSASPFNRLLAIERQPSVVRAVQLVGKSSLGEADKVTLDVARLIKEDFLQQNGISTYDRYCPFYKTTAMLKNLVTYYEQAVKAVEGDTLTWAKVRDSTSDLWFRLTQMKFEDPAHGEEAVLKPLQALHADILSQFQQISE